MGVVCCTKSQNPELEIMAKTQDLKKITIPITPINILKIKRIQNNFRCFLSNKKKELLFNKEKNIIIAELKKKTLVNESIVLKSKSEDFYKKLIEEGRIGDFKTEYMEKLTDLNEEETTKNLRNPREQIEHILVHKKENFTSINSKKTGISTMRTLQSNSSLNSTNNCNNFKVIEVKVKNQRTRPFVYNKFSGYKETLKSNVLSTRASVKNSGHFCSFNNKNSEIDGVSFSNERRNEQGTGENIKQKIKIISAFRKSNSIQSMYSNSNCLTENNNKTNKNTNVLNNDFSFNENEDFYFNLALFKKSKNINTHTFYYPKYVVVSQNEVYIGSWNCSKKFQGYGVLFTFNYKTKRDKKTEGIFVEGKLEGRGRIFSSENEYIIGNFIEGKLNGEGEYHRNDDSVYKGFFRGGLPHGNGRETFNNGSYFDGFYLSGKKKYGKFVFNDGSIYQGEFDNDLFSGKGRYKWNKGKAYEGMWKDGLMNGKGKLVYADGTFYEGDFDNGLRSGHGTYRWNENRYFVGEWKNDKQNGSGVYYKDGNVFKGIWKDGVLEKKDKNKTISKAASFHNKTLSSNYCSSDFSNSPISAKSSNITSTSGNNCKSTVYNPVRGLKKKLIYKK